MIKYNYSIIDHLVTYICNMSNYIFEGGKTIPSGNVNIRIILFHFEDENGVHIIYSPHLDVSGYGKSISAAKDSFVICLDDFIDYTMKKKTISKILTKLGWTRKGTAKKPKKIIAPSITSIIGENDYVSDIFDKYSVNTYHENVSIPEYA